MSDPVLELHDISVQYERRGRSPVPAVVGASCAVERGKILGLVGESGCGKSTLARAAAGLLAPSAGTILFEGEPVTPLERRPRPRRETRLQMIFQDAHASLNPRRTIGAQIGDGLRASHPALRSEQSRAEAGALLERVGLAPDAVDRYPHQFSGGQRQRICIARVLAAEPTAIVADEPISSLDASAQAHIAHVLVAAARDLDVGILFISHDLAVVKQISDDVAVMYLGEIVEAGPAVRLWNDPKHPYTQALIGAVPWPDGGGRLPQALAGEVPDPVNPPPGCRFHTRCTQRLDHCSSTSPALLPLGPDRRVACWLHAGDAPVPSPRAEVCEDP